MHNNSSALDLGGHFVTHDDIGYRETASRLEHTESLSYHAALVARQVDNAIGDDDIDRIMGQRDVLDLAF